LVKEGKEHQQVKEEKEHQHAFDTLEMMSMLIGARWTFASAWTNVLQYALFDRSRSTTKTKYTQMQKPYSQEAEMVEAVLRRDDVMLEDRVLRAKAVARSVMQTMFEKGIPELGPKPLTEFEKRRAVGLGVEDYPYPFGAGFLIDFGALLQSAND